MSTTSVYGRRWSPSGPGGERTVLEYSAASHVGLVRSVNEDAFLAGPPVFVVADGMGGYSLGNVASGLVVDAFGDLSGRDAIEPSDLQECIARSRSAIAELGGDETSSPGATVIAAAYVLQSGRGYWLIAHAGDSRAYSWRAGELEQVTRDHTVVQELIDAGELDEVGARQHPDRHVVTRGVGACVYSDPEFTLLPAEAGSRLVLCTDGLTGELSPDRMKAILDGAVGSQGAVDDLVGAAVASGGHDNVTVMVVDVSIEGEDVREDTVETRLRREDTVPGSRRAS